MYGSQKYTVEWDGKLYGGGKLSQRYWEYFIVVDMLDLSPDSIVLDIGGGNGFFAELIAPYVRKVIILDANQTNSMAAAGNIERIIQHADADVLRQVLAKGVTHVSCISVFEHIPDAVREQIIIDIDGHFLGNRFVTTFEFHPLQCLFEHQLTTRTMSTMLAGFRNYYPERIESSPMRCENAFGKIRTPFSRRKKQYIGMVSNCAAISQGGQ